MKQILKIAFIINLLLFGVVFAQSQPKTDVLTAKTDPKPPSIVKGPVTPSIHDVLMAIKGLVKQFADMQNEIAIIKKTISPGKPPEPPKPPICPAYSPYPCPVGQYHDTDILNTNGCYMPGPCVPNPVPIPVEPIADCSSNANWKSYIWTFKDGKKSASCVRKDVSEDFLLSIARTCSGVSFTGWRPDAGNDADYNKTNFGIPECGQGGVNVGTVTKPGTGTTITSVPEEWKTCFSSKGLNAGSTKLDIDEALQIINAAIAARSNLNYSSIKGILYTPISDCERQTNFYISTYKPDNSTTVSGGSDYAGSATSCPCWNSSGFCPWTNYYNGQNYCVGILSGTNVCVLQDGSHLNKTNYTADKCPAGISIGGGSGTRTGTTYGCGQYDNNETACRGASGCEWKIPTGSYDSKYYCMSTGSYSGGSGSGASSCPGDIGTLLGSGCHLMYTKNDGTNRYCNSAMDKHIDGPNPSIIVDGCSSFTASLNRSSLLAQIFQLFFR